MGWTLIQDQCPCKKGKWRRDRDRDIQRQRTTRRDVARGRVKVKAGTVGTCRQTKDGQQSTRSWETGTEQSLLYDPEKKPTLPTSIFQTASHWRCEARPRKPRCPLCGLLVSSVVEPADSPRFCYPLPCPYSGLSMGCFLEHPSLTPTPPRQSGALPGFPWDLPHSTYFSVSIHRKLGARERLTENRLSTTVGMRKGALQDRKARCVMARTSQDKGLPR